MTGRAWAVATVATIVFSAGIGTATAGKLPPAGGGAPLTQSAVEGVLAGGTITMPDAATTGLTVRGATVFPFAEDMFRVEYNNGSMRFAVGSTGLVEIGDVLDLVSSGGYIRQNGQGVKFNDNIMPVSSGSRDVGQAALPWQEGHIREAVPSNDAQSGADSGDGNPGVVTDDCVTDYCECTCLDTDGCTVTKIETGADVSRLQCWVTVGSNACTFADQSGVLEVDGASITVDPGDGVCFRYTTDNEWHQVIAP